MPDLEPQVGSDKIANTVEPHSQPTDRPNVPESPVDGATSEAVAHNDTPEDETRSSERSGAPTQERMWRRVSGDSHHDASGIKRKRKAGRPSRPTGPMPSRNPVGYIAVAILVFGGAYLAFKFFTPKPQAETSAASLTKPSVDVAAPSVNGNKQTSTTIAANIPDAPQLSPSTGLVSPKAATNSPPLGKQSPIAGSQKPTAGKGAAGSQKPAPGNQQVAAKNGKRAAKMVPKAVPPHAGRMQLRITTGRAWRYQYWYVLATGRTARLRSRPRASRGGLVTVWIPAMYNQPGARMRIVDVRARKVAWTPIIDTSKPNAMGPISVITVGPRSFH